MTVVLLSVIGRGARSVIVPTACQEPAVVNRSSTAVMAVHTTFAMAIWTSRRHDSGTTVEDTGPSCLVAWGAYHTVVTSPLSFRNCPLLCTAVAYCILTNSSLHNTVLCVHGCILPANLIMLFFRYSPFFSHDDITNRYGSVVSGNGRQFIISLGSHHAVLSVGCWYFLGLILGAQRIWLSLDARQYDVNQRIEGHFSANCSSPSPLSAYRLLTVSICSFLLLSSASDTLRRQCRCQM